MSIRNSLFWFVDFLHGSPIQKHYKLIHNNLGNYKKDPETLRLLLKHATETTSFYKDYQGKDSLDEFPVVNKNIIRENFKSFLSSLYSSSQLKATTTSGSTGTPFTIYKDKNKLNCHLAAMIYFNEKALLPFGQRLYYLRVWNSMNKKDKKSQVIQNIIPVEVAKFNKDEVYNLLNEIQRFRSPVSLLGFASALTLLSKHSIKSNVTNIRSIISMSEHLPQSARKSLQETFKCPVVSRYSNMENGFIAQQLPDKDYYVVNSADFKVELLKFDNNTSVKKGEIGRIVITDLYNFGMPLIRYDTGDVGRYDIIDGKYVLTEIEGRVADMLTDTKGEMMSSIIITNTMWKYKEVKQYQFIQKNKGVYVLKLNVSSTFKDEDELRLTLRSYLGSDAKISFEYVDEIPILNSGKRRSVINELL